MKKAVCNRRLRMIASICVVAYNEHEHLPRLFKDICSQSYPHLLMQIVLINSVSTDNTRQLMEKFKNDNTDFYSVTIIENQKKNQAAGWNIAIENAIGDVIIRIDAHTSIPFDFVEKNIKCMEYGEFVSGGPRPSIIDDVTLWRKTLLLSENSMFGSSIAPFRRNTKKTYVKTIFHAAYRREVFQKVGGFNENLGRTEDNEMHYRIIKAGYNLCFDSNIISYQVARSSLIKLIEQKYGNGYWIGLTVGVCPKCLSLYHFVPFSFILGIIVTTVLAILGFPLLAECMWSIYWMLAVLMAFMSAQKERKNPTMFALPLLFFALHVGYGIGTLCGLAKMPFLHNRLRNCTAIERIKCSMNKEVIT